MAHRHGRARPYGLHPTKSSQNCGRTAIFLLDEREQEWNKSHTKQVTGVDQARIGNRKHSTELSTMSCWCSGTADKSQDVPPCQLLLLPCSSPPPPSSRCSALLARFRVQPIASTRCLQRFGRSTRDGRCEGACVLPCGSLPLQRLIMLRGSLSRYLLARAMRCGSASRIGALPPDFGVRADAERYQQQVDHGDRRQRDPGHRQQGRGRERDNRQRLKPDVLTQSE